jgi:hypothetical protein
MCLDRLREYKWTLKAKMLLVNLLLRNTEQVFIYLKAKRTKLSL